MKVFVVNPLDTKGKEFRESPFSVVILWLREAPSTRPVSSRGITSTEEGASGRADDRATATTLNHGDNCEEKIQRHTDACKAGKTLPDPPEAGSIMWLWECRWDLCSSDCNNRDQMGTRGQNSNPQAQHCSRACLSSFWCCCCFWETDERTEDGVDAPTEDTVHRLQRAMMRTFSVSAFAPCSALLHSRGRLHNAWATLVRGRRHFLHLTVHGPHAVLLPSSFLNFLRLVMLMLVWIAGVDLGGHMEQLS